MAESGVIREFLVALGFKIDRPALENFEGGIKKATRAAIALGGAVEGMAAAVAIGVARFSSNLEQLYFASQRTGSTATNLRAFQRAAQDFGASAGEALGSVENLAQSMRMNPGNVALLESLGVHLKRTKNGTYDATDALIQFGNAMRARGYFKPGEFYMAEQYARMFGISERTLLALRNGRFNAEYARMQKKLHGHGFQKAARDAHRFMVSLRTLETQLEVFGAQVEDAIQKKLGGNLKQLNSWIEKHGPALAGQLVTAALQLLHVAEWIGRKIEWLIPKFERLNEDTHGWAGKLLALYTALRLVGGLEVISGIMRLSAAFTTLGARILGVRAAVAGASSVTAGGLASAAVPGTLLGVGAGWLFDKLFPHNWLAEFGRWAGSGLEGFTHRPQRAMDYFISQGWTAWQAAGIVARLQKESGLLRNATGDQGRAYGLAQWHSARQAEFERVMGRSIKGSSYMQQLAFVNWELRHDPQYGGRALADAKTAAAAARIYTLHFERPAHGRAQAAATARAAEILYRRMVAREPVLARLQANWRGPGGALAGAPTINAHTEVHVHGSGDPRATAEHVTTAIRRVNADIVRNFVSAVQ